MITSTTTTVWHSSIKARRYLSRRAAIDAEPVSQPYKLVGEVVAWNHQTEERRVDFRWIDFDVLPGTKLYAMPPETPQEPAKGPQFSTLLRLSLHCGCAGEMVRCDMRTKSIFVELMKITVGLACLCALLMYHWNSDEERNCAKARDLYGAETKLYPSGWMEKRCYVKRNNKWVYYSGYVYDEGSVKEW